MVAGTGRPWLSTWRQPGPSPDAGFVSSWWGVLGQYSDPKDMEVGMSTPQAETERHCAHGQRLEQNEGSGRGSCCVVTAAVQLLTCV